ncbi:hypothetical protein D3C85_814980 [compost metagenome]
MSFYNTGNPVPSKDPRDLDDNAKILDEFVNGTEDTYVDRKGVERRTLFSIEHDADSALLRSDLADPAKGAKLVKTLQSGVGAAARTQQNKNLDSVTPLDYVDTEPSGIFVWPTPTQLHNAIQAALDTGRSVECMNFGVEYYISDTIVHTTENQRVYGDAVFTVNDPDKSVLSVGADGFQSHGITYSQGQATPEPTSFVPAIIDSVACSQVRFFGGGVKDTAYFGVLVDKGGNNWEFHSVDVRRTGRDGIDIRGGYGHKVCNSTFEDTGDDAIVITNRRDGGVTYQATDFNISGNTIRRPGFHGVGGSGIRAGGKRGEIYGNNIFEPERYGIVLSCLDADASVRPDQIVCTGNNIYGLNPLRDNLTDPVAAYALRDIDNVQIFGGFLDCRGSNGTTVGNAYLLTNNFTGAIAVPSNKSLKANGVYVRGATDVLRTENFNTAEIILDGGTWAECASPTFLNNNPAYTMGRYIVRNIVADNPTGNAFFKRTVGQPVVTYFEASGCRIVSSATPPQAPFLLGDVAETGKITRALIENNNFNAAPDFGRIPATYLEFDYDHFYKMLANGPATIVNGTSTIAVAHGLPIAPQRDWVTFNCRLPQAIGLTGLDGTNLTFSTLAAVGANTIVDWAVKPSKSRYKDGVRS